MRAGGGHDKGAGFERDMCRFLSRWVTNNERDDLFWRSSNSGGRATVAMKKGEVLEYSQSDIAPTHKLAYDLLERFSIECKFYADLHLQDLPFDRKSNIAEFWNQARRDASRVNKRAMLIARQNRKPTLIGLSQSAYNEIRDKNLRKVRAGLFPHAIISTRHDLVLLDMEMFFQCFTPEQLRTL
jgi:hypothetical protein